MAASSTRSRPTNHRGMAPGLRIAARYQIARFLEGVSARPHALSAASMTTLDAFPSVPGGGWPVVTEIVAPHLEADVAVRIAPKVRPHGVGRKTDRIRISGARTGTATAIHPVRFGSGMDRQPRDIDLMSRGTRTPQASHRRACCRASSVRELFSRRASG